jgi:hypothetical protein
MGIASFVRQSFNSSLTTLDAEDCTIGGVTKKGVVEDIGSELFIGEGGDQKRRALRISFPGNAFATVPSRRATATCRSLTWQITSVDNSPGALVIELEEPERRG